MILLVAMLAFAVSQNPNSNSTCDSAAITQCVDALTACTQQNGSDGASGICPCYDGYLQCLSKVTGCGDSIRVARDVIAQPCATVGCTVSQCNALSAPAPDNSSTCNIAAISECAGDLTNCTTRSPGVVSELCPCYGGYVQCLSKVSGCGDAARTATESIANTCSAVGCTSSQCMGLAAVAVVPSTRSSSATTITGTIKMTAETGNPSASSAAALGSPPPLPLVLVLVAVAVNVIATPLF
jgi:hypothetical protein